MNWKSNIKPLYTESPFHGFWPWGRALFALLLLGATLNAARAASYVLEGYNKGDSNNWFAGNLQDWQELDYIPCRVRITGGPVVSQTFTITFPHIMGKRRVLRTSTTSWLRQTWCFSPRRCFSARPLPTGHTPSPSR